MMVQSFACFYTHMYIPVSATRGRASQTDIMNYYVRCRFRVGRHGLDFVWVHLQIDMQRPEIKSCGRPRRRRSMVGLRMLIAH